MKVIEGRLRFGRGSINTFNGEGTICFAPTYFHNLLFLTFVLNLASSYTKEIWINNTLISNYMANISSICAFQKTVIE
jgi:hypothetical protein